MFKKAGGLKLRLDWMMDVFIKQDFCGKKEFLSHTRMLKRNFRLSSFCSLCGEELYMGHLCGERLQNAIELFEQRFIQISLDMKDK